MVQQAPEKPAKVALNDRQTRKGKDGLTTRQRALVAQLMTGEGTVAEAARAAGYKDASAAYKALALDTVKDALDQAARDEVRRDVPLAIRTRRYLVSQARSEYVRLEAAKDVLDRAGLVAPKTDGVTVGAINVQINLGD